MSAVHGLRTYTEAATDDLYIRHLEVERATLAEDLAEARACRDQALADVTLLRAGQTCLLHQLAAAREWKAQATLWAIVVPLVAVLALRWLA